MSILDLNSPFGLLSGGIRRNCTHIPEHFICTIHYTAVRKGLQVYTPAPLSRMRKSQLLHHNDLPLGPARAPVAGKRMSQLKREKCDTAITAHNNITKYFTSFTYTSFYAYLKTESASSSIPQSEFFFPQHINWLCISNAADRLFDMNLFRFETDQIDILNSFFRLFQSNQWFLSSSAVFFIVFIKFESVRLTMCSLTLICRWSCVGRDSHQSYFPSPTHQLKTRSASIFRF